MLLDALRRDVFELVGDSLVGPRRRGELSEPSSRTRNAPLAQLAKLFIHLSSHDFQKTVSSLETVGAQC